MNVTALIVFILLFALVTVLGFFAARWRRGDLDSSTNGAWPAADSARSSPGSCSAATSTPPTPSSPSLRSSSAPAPSASSPLPYTIIVYPFVFVVMPRLWSVASKHGYVTAADFVRGRYDSIGSRWPSRSPASSRPCPTSPSSSWASRSCSPAWASRERISPATCR